ncbi:YqjF family protein [Thermogemmata fonticola]|uniref:DUF2071 domain-containing protein n=1 Tax=Thermogemmata fonticola TaxID=2755323 RepID=A0A7V8VGA1_9BACT|nr:DUF2071 domain-containing protein [Thermogemmata fonticola]MBA2227509.1 DUF2071 domain-containing protein [Thermogemmata fonticola]
MNRRFLTAEWRYLAMLNFEIDPDLLRPFVPPGTELDTWQGKTFISLVGFRFLRTRLLGIPIPFHRNFEEVNLRFYVRRHVGGESRRGVVFVKEIVPKWAIAVVARWVYNENYVACPMDSHIQLPDPARGQGGIVEYSWGKGAARNTLQAEFAGLPSYPVAGSLEEFIVEHYWGYVSQRSGAVLEYGVEHPPWRVWRATATRLECDVANCYGRPFVEVLGQEPRSALVAEGSAVTVFWGRQLPQQTAMPSNPAL